MKEIRIEEVGEFRIGQMEDTETGTGCTVLISEKGMCAGLDVRGGGPAGRETELLKPLAAAETIHAIVLGGGSAFGLDAAGGVMEYLRDKDIGFDVGVTKVPLVCQSDIFDLTVGSAQAYPDHRMGYEAAEKAFTGEHGNYRCGNYGAGTGATVGKLRGMTDCMKSGIGSYAVQVGELKVGALVAVNALGDIFDHKTGKKIAGLLNPEHTGFDDSLELMCQRTEEVENKFTGNTTIGIIVTNASFSKSRLCKIASMAQNGYARSIRPVHTSADGDSIYAVSAGEIRADMDLTGTLAAEVMSVAIVRAVQAAESAYGYPCAEEVFQK